MVLQPKSKFQKSQIETITTFFVLSFYANFLGGSVTFGDTTMYGQLGKPQ